MTVLRGDKVGRRLLAALSGSTPAFTRAALSFPVATGSRRDVGRRVLSALAGSSPAFTAEPVDENQRRDEITIQPRTTGR
ncbi:hypothetical protein [Nocardia pseudovaccinii]|uniref:hypothetical protein n=1 Tax=Nocardia pseudovaccinii TaxID=189540 RepID=UPI0007A44CC2|nr:hypothetical protein [Nocardia pseudovaccinii]